MGILEVNLVDTIEQVMKLLSMEYPQFKVDEEGERYELWILMVKDFTPEIIQHSVYHLLSLARPFPPSIGEVRRQCALLAKGELREPSGASSWGRIMEHMAKKKIQLSDLEKEALKKTKSVYDLRISSNIEADRARYIQVFDKLVEERTLEWCTLKEVKTLVDKHRPALPPGKVPKELPGSEQEGVMSYEEAREQFGERFLEFEDNMKDFSPKVIGDLKGKQ